MAFVKRRTVILLLAAILLISIALRYPLVEHERYQSDSYFIHILSESIADSGQAKWTFSPLSYFGYYPASYSSGMPFVLAEISILTGLDMAVVILLSGMVMGMLMALGVFLLARQFIYRPQYALLAALLVTLGSRFVDTSYWNGSARAPFVVFMVLALVVFLRFRNTQQRVMLGIGVLMIVGSLAVHHMAVLFILLGIAYIASVVAVHYLLPRIRIRKRGVATAYVAAMGVAILLFSFGFFELFGETISETYSEGSLFHFEPAIVSAMSNMAASYVNQVGLVMIFAAIGFVLLLRKSRISFENFFLVGLILLFIPALGGGLYVSMVLSVFISILGVAAIQLMYNSSKNKKALVASVMVLIALSLVLPVWSVDRWNDAEQRTGDQVEVDDQLFTDATYIASFGGDWFAISNTDVQAMQLGAFGDTRFLRSDIIGAINGDITAKDVEETISWSDDPFPQNLYSWYTYSESPDIEGTVQGLIIQGVYYYSYDTSPSIQLAHDYYETHPRILVVIDNDWPDEHVNVWGVAHSEFPQELRNSSGISGTYSEYFESYMLYRSESITIYSVDLGL